MNPLFPDTTDKDDGYVLPRNDTHRVEPGNPAVDLIRRKIDALYVNEPNASDEIAKTEHAPPPRSPHQQFMYQLTTSGKPLAEIQSAWHRYYGNLSDDQKRQVWQEFYSANNKDTPTVTTPTVQPAPAPTNYFADTEEQAARPVVVHHVPPDSEPAKPDRRTAASIKKEVLRRVRASHSAQIKAKQHLQSLAFGIGLGALVLLIFLFGLFNELVLVPFIKPSSQVSATPIILSTDAPAPSDAPELIIPKINVQLPVIYGSQSVAEKDVQAALNDGVFHYSTTAVPGQNGNAAYFGHSSNNIFNKGKYKFAFVLLKDLEPGDIFYLTHDKKVYTYKVYSKKIVNPDDTWVLGPVDGKTATATLITCDPPGTTLHRLVVWGEQISPDPGGNSAAATPSPALQNQQLPGKGPSAWSRFWSWVF